jgi:hypothetical protein
MCRSGPHGESDKARRFLEAMREQLSKSLLSIRYDSRSRRTSTWWSSAVNFSFLPSCFLLRLSVCDPALVTRLPDPVLGACFAGSHFPRPQPLAPSAPPLVAQFRSQTSQLLQRGLTSRARSSLASQSVRSKQRYRPARPRVSLHRSVPREIIPRSLSQQPT